MKTSMIKTLFFSLNFDCIHIIFYNISFPEGKGITGRYLILLSLDMSFTNTIQELTGWVSWYQNLDSKRSNRGYYYPCDIFEQSRKNRWISIPEKLWKGFLFGILLLPFFLLLPFPTLPIQDQMMQHWHQCLMVCWFWKLHHDVWYCMMSCTAALLLQLSKVVGHFFPLQVWFQELHCSSL